MKTSYLMWFMPFPMPTWPVFRPSMMLASTTAGLFFLSPLEGPGQYLQRCLLGRVDMTVANFRFLIYLTCFFSFFSLSLSLPLHFCFFLSIYLSLYLFIYHSLYLSIFPPSPLFLYLSIYLSLFPSLSLSLSLSLFPSLSLSLSFILGPDLGR